MIKTKYSKTSQVLTKSYENMLLFQTAFHPSIIFVLCLIASDDSPKVWGGTCPPCRLPKKCPFISFSCSFPQFCPPCQVPKLSPPPVGKILWKTLRCSLTRGDDLQKIPCRRDPVENPVFVNGGGLIFSQNGLGWGEGCEQLLLKNMICNVQYQQFVSGCNQSTLSYYFHNTFITILLIAEGHQTNECTNF